MVVRYDIAVRTDDDARSAAFALLRPRLLLRLLPVLASRNAEQVEELFEAAVVAVSAAITCAGRDFLRVDNVNDSLDGIFGRIGEVWISAFLIGGEVRADVRCERFGGRIAVLVGCFRYGVSSYSACNHRDCQHPCPYKTLFHRNNKF